MTHPHHHKRRACPRQLQQLEQSVVEALPHELGTKWQMAPDRQAIGNAKLQGPSARKQYVGCNAPGTHKCHIDWEYNTVAQRILIRLYFVAAWRKTAVVVQPAPSSYGT